MRCSNDSDFLLSAISSSEIYVLFRDDCYPDKDGFNCRDEEF